MKFTIIRLDTDGTETLHVSAVDADDIDKAARVAVDSCPDDQFVIAVAQTDCLPLTVEPGQKP